MFYLAHTDREGPTRKLCPLGVPNEAMAPRSPNGKMVPASTCGATYRLRFCRQLHAVRHSVT